MMNPETAMQIIQAGVFTVWIPVVLGVRASRLMNSSLGVGRCFSDRYMAMPVMWTRRFSSSSFRHAMDGICGAMGRIAPTVCGSARYPTGFVALGLRALQEPPTTAARMWIPGASSYLSRLFTAEMPNPLTRTLFRLRSSYRACGPFERFGVVGGDLLATKDFALPP